MLGETLTALPFLVDQSIIQCMVLCVVDTTILVVVVSAGAQNMHYLGCHVLQLQAFKCCAPSTLLAIQLSCSVASPYEAAEVA